MDRWKGFLKKYLPCLPGLSKLNLTCRATRETYETPMSYLQVPVTGKEWGGPAGETGERLENVQPLFGGRPRRRARGGEPPGWGAGRGPAEGLRGTVPIGSGNWEVLKRNEQGPTYV